nr:MAG TPA: hypothetical protein [Caudoviricetes sp.]
MNTKNKTSSKVFKKQNQTKKKKGYPDIRKVGIMVKNYDHN